MMNELKTITMTDELEAVAARNEMTKIVITKIPALTQAGTEYRTNKSTLTTARGDRRQMRPQRTQPRAEMPKAGPMARLSKT
jgi:hypothetical protein